MSDTRTIRWIPDTAIDQLEAKLTEAMANCERLEMRNIQLESERNELQKMILDFCEGENWTVQRWIDQKHIKPLFDIAEKIKDNQELTDDELV